MQHADTHLTVEKITDILSGLSMFAGVEAQALQPFARAAQQRMFDKGDVLYNEGEDATYFYVVLSGWLKLTHTTPGGDEVVLAMQSGGDVLGEYALFEEQTYKTSAQVVKPATALSIPIDLLEKQMEVSPRITRNLLVSMVKCQRRHELQAIQEMLYAAPQRIGAFLIKQVPPQQRTDGITFQLPYDKTLVAATLGMRGATFSRALQQLRDVTAIGVQGDKVTIRSMQRLMEYAGACYHQTYPVEKKSCLT